MGELETMREELTPPERWIFDNTQLIADIVLWSKEGRGVITRERYDSDMEDELIRLLRMMPRIASAEKADDGILIVAKQS